MKVRLVEVPICDLCSKDGEVFQVTSLSRESSSWTITRCERHRDKLRAEGETSEVLHNGEAVVGTPRTVSRESEELRAAIMTAVAEEPGLRPIEYARRLGVTRQRFGHQSQMLEREGRLRTSGATSGKRLWPSEYKEVVTTDGEGVPALGEHRTG